MFNTSSYCRSCGITDLLESKTLTNVWNNKRLIDVFEQCTGISLISDNFSQIVCLDCYNKLIDAYNFRILSQETHFKLVKELENIIIKEEVVDVEPEEIKEEIFVTPLIPKKDIESNEANDENYFTKDTDRKTGIIQNFKEKTPQKRVASLCLGCKQIFKSNISLKRHLDQKKNDPTHQWRCCTCLVTFTTLKDLSQHLIKSHKEQICPECKETTYGTTGLKKHLREIHKQKRPKDCCPYCAKFVQRLKKHVASVHENKLYICDICNRGCDQLYTLRTHMRIHTGETPFSCLHPGCGKKFKQSSQLRQHERAYHIQVENKPVPCDVCEKSFKNKYLLKEHRKIHFGSSFKCNKCDSVFTLEKYLKGHIKDVHELNPIPCPECGKIFQTQSKLQYHRRQHLGTKYICSMCDRFFCNKQLLVDHIYSHHEKVQNYICPVEGCGRSYFRSDGLRRHKRKIHTLNR